MISQEKLNKKSQIEAFFLYYQNKKTFLVTVVDIVSEFRYNVYVRIDFWLLKELRIGRKIAHNLLTCGISASIRKTHGERFG